MIYIDIKYMKFSAKCNILITQILQNIYIINKLLIYHNLIQLSVM